MGQSATPVTVEGGRNYPASQNYARFEVVTDFTLGNPVQMNLVSTDLLVDDPTTDTINRRQKVRIRDITAFVYLPTCSPGFDPDTDPPVLLPPQFSSSPILGLWHSYRFPIRLNNMNTVFEAQFVYNADKQRSRQVMTLFKTALTKLEVWVERVFIDPAWTGPGVNVALGLLIEFDCIDSEND